ncbi:TetR/AcrR family transcriptional regulator [Iodobacter sp. HSC-16F04]|uniref:TetR/AcrR family transcriptional regulator n=1 Tax=Iodobacter violaceini TaxID=3044271 RepID=A0ABX0KRU5_9NEIS|nr:TetR/AcrR family transcriptional regulator [Iodobacter violacea]NHQ86409.1 TetR/AcrR family transcriptional regulator [Iodobacter violacea]
MTDITHTRQRRKEARPGEIIEAALILFHQKGYSATKLDDVARAAGVTKGTVYLYFSNKEALFKAAISETIHPNLDRIEELAINSTESATQRLRTAIASWATALNDCKGSISKLMISEAGNFPDLTDFYIETVVKRSRLLLIKLIQAGIDSGEFRQTDPDMLARVLFSPILLTSIWRHTYARQDPITYDLNQLAQFHLDIVLHGIAIAPEHTL